MHVSKVTHNLPCATLKKLFYDGKMTIISHLNIKRPEFRVSVLVSVNSRDRKRFLRTTSAGGHQGRSRVARPHP